MELERKLRVVACIAAMLMLATGCATEETEPYEVTTGRYYAQRKAPQPTPEPTPQAVEQPAVTPEPQPQNETQNAEGSLEQYLLAAEDPWVKRAKIRGFDWPLVKNEGPYRQYEPQSGRASFYYQPQKLATGEKFNPEDMTAAHRTLPFGTIVRCTRTDTGASVEVMINDRGPYKRGRIIDLSRAAARKLNQIRAGVVPVKVEVIAYPMIETMGPKGNG